MQPVSNAPVRAPDWRFLLASPWHLLALGFGSGLPRVAPGTWGTLLAWGTFVALDPWLSDFAWIVLIAASLALGAAAAHRAGRALGRADSGHIVIDEMAAFWIVLLLLPAGSGATLQAVAFLLFRLFDIVKPPPIRGIDARIKNGVGVMLDDLIAAFYALLVLALWLRLS
jgi:phosphatidylglycerophosphatase A